MEDLRKGEYYPIYFLMGEEDFFIDEVANYIENNVLSPDERDFNQTVIYGDDTTIDKIIIDARRFPVMSKYQVILIREANALKGIEGDESDDSGWLLYASKPMQSTILVFLYRGKTLDKRRKVYKTLEKTAAILESKRIYESKMPEWVMSYVHSKGYNIQSAAAQVLTVHLGNDLTKVTNELSKLMTLLPAGSIINTQHIEDNIGISKEYNIFELNKTIGQRDITKAFTIVAHFAKNQKDNPIQVIISQLFTYFSKLLLVHTSYKNMDKNSLATALGVNVYFVGEYLEAARNFPPEKIEKIIGYLRHYDAFSKGVNDAGTDGGELLKELITLIMI
ncbi:MAG TPA: DNA polymerase III subunit delta [Salinivirgaceae bacterium]|nr:DNA polymerase III subunit delta [Salinivirgaceae bacterium]